MKGFIKILEAIVAAIILLTSLTFFFRAEIRETNWNDIMIKTRGEDMIYAFERSGMLQDAIQHTNIDKINNTIVDMDALPPAIDWSILIKGIPPPIIYIQTKDANDANDLKSRLGGLTFDYHGRLIEIRIDPGSLDNIRPEANIFFIKGYQSLSPYRTKLNDFLARDGTIFMLTDLNSGQVNDYYMNDTFGLKWFSSSSGTASGTFYDPLDYNKTSFRIRKYHNGTCGDFCTESFTFSSASNKIAIDNKTIVTSGSQSLVKINDEIIDGHGRTVWFASYDAAQKETNATLRAAILWASGEQFRMHNGVKKINPYHIDSGMIVSQKNGNNQADTYLAVMTLWNVLMQGA